MKELVKAVLHYKKLSLFVGLVLTFWVADYLHFISVCHKYSTLSHKIGKELPPIRDREMIVVLTGDRKRIPMALDLLRSRKNALLLISGAGKGATLTDLVNSQEAQAAKVREVWNQILVESISTSTIENAKESGKIIQKHGIHRVILVTSEYHMLRSLLIFQSLAAGTEYITYPAPSEFTGFLEGNISDLFPALFKTSVEYWKYFVFRNYFLNRLYD